MELRSYSAHREEMRLILQILSSQYHHKGYCHELAVSQKHSVLNQSTALIKFNHSNVFLNESDLFHSFPAAKLLNDAYTYSDNNKYAA